jgi:hypothetical protein
MTDETIELIKLERHGITDIFCIIIKPLVVRFIVLKVAPYWKWKFVIEYIYVF